jgi:signal transduction histidine kinase
LFQSFYRASNVGTISGTGIGLVVVDFVVKKHGYHIEFNSVENEGTEVKIIIQL